MAVSREFNDASSIFERDSVIIFASFLNSFPRRPLLGAASMTSFSTLAKSRFQWNGEWLAVHGWQFLQEWNCITARDTLCQPRCKNRCNVYYTTMYDNRVQEINTFHITTELTTLTLKYKILKRERFLSGVPFITN